MSRQMNLYHFSTRSNFYETSIDFLTSIGSRTTITVQVKIAIYSGCILAKFGDHGLCIPKLDNFTTIASVNRGKRQVKFRHFSKYQLETNLTIMVKTMMNIK